MSGDSRAEREAAWKEAGSRLSASTERARRSTTTCIHLRKDTVTILGLHETPEDASPSPPLPTRTSSFTATSLPRPQLSSSSPRSSGGSYSPEPDTELLTDSILPDALFSDTDSEVTVEDGEDGEHGGDGGDGGDGPSEALPPDAVDTPSHPARHTLASPSRIPEHQAMGAEAVKAGQEFGEIFASCVAPWGDDRDAVLTAVYGVRGTVLRSPQGGEGGGGEDKQVSGLKRVFRRRGSRSIAAAKLSKYSSKLKSFVAKRASLLAKVRDKEDAARKKLAEEIAVWEHAAMPRMVRRARTVLLHPIHIARMYTEVYSFQRKLGISHMGVIQKVLLRSEDSINRLSLDEVDSLAIPIADLAGKNNDYVSGMMALIGPYEAQVKSLLRLYAEEAKAVKLYSRDDRIALAADILAKTPTSPEGYHAEDGQLQALFNSLVRDRNAPEGAAIAKFVEATMEAGASVTPEAVVGFVDALTNDLASIYKIVDNEVPLHLYVDRAVLPLVVSPLWSYCLETASAADAQFRAQVAWLRKLPPRDLGVSPVFVQGAERAQTELGQQAIEFASLLGLHTVPADIAHDLVELAHCVYGSPQDGEGGSAGNRSTLGADDTFPLFVYVLVHARLGVPWAVLRFLNEFCSMAVFPPEAQYCAVTVEAALTHINEVSVADIDSHRS